MNSPRLFLSGLIFAATLTSQPASAAWDEYDDSQSHPLRITAYLLHPVGWLTEWMVMRPFHILVSATKPQEAFFGHRPHPPLLAGEQESTYYYTTPEKKPAKQASVQPVPPAPVAAPETVRIVEVPVEKIVVKEVPVQKIVEVEKLVFSPVAFAFDSARLTDLGKGQVYIAAQRLKEKADITVVIEGHTDNRGNDEYNRKLGLERAQTVMNELAGLGIDRGRMSTATMGEGKPLIGSDSAWGYAANRRVEFQVKAAR
jgi:outer membrane protein OmpA-like peptidoglycan-associated protein